MRISWDFWLWNLTPSIFPTIFMGKKNWKIHGNIMSRGQKLTPVTLWFHETVFSGKSSLKKSGKNHPTTGNSPLGNPHEITTSSTMVCPEIYPNICLLVKAPFLISPDDHNLDYDQTHPVSIYHHINHNSLIMPISVQGGAPKVFVGLGLMNPMN